MKRVLLSAFLLSLMIAIPVRASITVEESTDPEYIMNSGFSELTAEDILTLKNRANGKPAEPLYDRKTNKIVHWYKRIFGYVDPAIDEADRLHHNIQPSPSFTDL